MRPHIEPWPRHAATIVNRAKSLKLCRPDTHTAFQKL